MSSGSWIRVKAKDANLDARTMNAEIQKILGRKARSITSDPALRKRVGLAYVRNVTDFVPRRHGDLQNSGMATDDGRVYWTATSKTGYNYAYIQYTNLNYNHPSRYGGHRPTAEWTDELRPGTAEWEQFIADITPDIKRSGL